MTSGHLIRLRRWRCQPRVQGSVPHADKLWSRVRTKNIPTGFIDWQKDIIMTITIMNRLIGAVVLGFAAAGGNIAADASVRPLAEQMSGMPSLAPLLNQIT